MVCTQCVQAVAVIAIVLWVDVVQRAHRAAWRRDALRVQWITAVVRITIFTTTTILAPALPSSTPMLPSTSPPL